MKGANMPDKPPSSQLVCRSCKRTVLREIRCQYCDRCPVCADKGFLRDGDDVTPCYNCNPDGMD